MTRRRRQVEPDLFSGQRAPRRPRMVDRVMGCFQDSPGLTADEVALMLAAPVTSVRPRVSELVAAGRLVDTGRRRPGVSTVEMTVWRVTDADGRCAGESNATQPSGQRPGAPSPAILLPA